MYPLLQITDLQLDFITEAETVTAVKGITFTVNRGDILGIAGESGSGKSVTSLAILQLLAVPPARYVSGSILFSPDGKQQFDLIGLDKKTLQAFRGRHASMIFQEPMSSLNPVFTCGDQVMEAILMHNRVNETEAKKKTVELFEKVQLPEPALIFNRYPHELSGGQKQRVMIAMAMSSNPALLICDEPTTALDVTVQKTVLELIRDLQASTGMGVIFITHDLGVIAEIASRVIIMYKGSIVEQGTVKDVFSHPQHAYTKGLLACRPALHPKGERLPVVSDFMDAVNKPATPLAGAPAPKGDVLIEAKNLSVWFPKKRSLFGRPLAFTRAVDDVSFEVYKGETLGLVGESGCGKTTLGRTLLRLIEPTAGSIRYEGSDLVSLDKTALKKFRSHMQIIFQDPFSSLNPSLMIGSALEEPLKVHQPLLTSSERRDRVLGLLEKVNLRPEHYYRYPHEFSGGQRQRIVIARALTLNPSFIVCDESVSALDVSVQAQVLNLLSDLKAEFGFTSIFISHDLSVVRYISDRIMVMHRGKIVESGPAEQVYVNPGTAYTKKLLAAIPTLKTALNG